MKNIVTHLYQRYVTALLEYIDYYVLAKWPVLSL